LELYHELHRDVRRLVDMTGFRPFIFTLTSTWHDHNVLTALAERWRDSTNTFHLTFGEATMTPLDFSALTGLRVGGEPIPYDCGLGYDEAGLTWFLGFVPHREREMAHYGQFARVCTGVPASQTEAEQKARCYLLYVFGASLYANRRCKVHFSLLPALRDFEKASQYDWGGPALATCYSFMGAVSRRRGTSLAGMWSLWEV
jgi:hypothetical protein